MCVSGLIDNLQSTFYRVFAICGASETLFSAGVRNSSAHKNIITASIPSDAKLDHAAPRHEYAGISKKFIPH